MITIYNQEADTLPEEEKPEEEKVEEKEESAE